MSHLYVNSYMWHGFFSQSSSKDNRDSGANVCIERNREKKRATKINEQTQLDIITLVVEINNHITNNTQRIRPQV